MDKQEELKRVISKAGGNTSMRSVLFEGRAQVWRLLRGIELFVTQCALKGALASCLSGDLRWRSTWNQAATT